MSPIKGNQPKAALILAYTPILGIGITAILIGFLAISNPQAALEASLRGVSVWWDVLFPALFPFFVLSELLLGFGVVHLAGTLLDPFMRPLFRLPGVGGFIVAMGFASGYPVGARLTSRMMEQNLLTRNEGERLVAITTTSDPIFLIGAVCIGFFGSLQPAPLLAIAHYSGALIIGIGAQFWSPVQAETVEVTSVKKNRIRSALAAMHRARIADGRSLGTLLQQALQSSLALMMIVGGLVVFFSATLELLMQSGLLALFRDLIEALLRLCGLTPRLSSPFVEGTFEVTLGAKAAAKDETIPLLHRIAAAAFVLSWAGLSVHAQVAGLMSRTSWRYSYFLKARLIHGSLAMLLVYLLWPFFQPASTTNASFSTALQAIPAHEHSKWLIMAYYPLSTMVLLALILIAGTAAIYIRGFRSR